MKKLLMIVTLLVFCGNVFALDANSQLYQNQNEYYQQQIIRQQQKQEMIMQQQLDMQRQQMQQQQMKQNRLDTQIPMQTHNPILYGPMGRY